MQCPCSVVYNVFDSENIRHLSPKSMSPFPANRRPKNYLFRRFRNLTANLTAYILGTKHDIDNRLSALTTTRSLLHSLKISWTLVNKRFKPKSAFLSTIRKFCILLHCQTSQTEISKRNSTKLCQTADGKSR